MTDVRTRWGIWLDWALRFAFACFCFSAPWSIAASQISLEFCSLFFVLVVIIKKYNPFTRPLRLFYWAVVVWWAWLLISGLASPTPEHSLLESRDEWLLIIVAVGVYLMQDKRWMAIMVTVMASGMLLVSVQGFAQYFFGVDWLAAQTPEPAPGFGYRVSGAYSGYVTFAGFFAVATVALTALLTGSTKWLRPAQRWTLIIAASIGGVLTVLTFGRIALVAMVGSLVLIAFLVGRRYRLWAVGLVIAALIAVVAIPGMRSWFQKSLTMEAEGWESSRLYIWQSSLDIIEDNPVVGVGVGHFREEYAARYSPTADQSKIVSHAHNDLLHFAAVLGIPGAVVYMGLWSVVLSYFIRGVRRNRDGASLAALAGSLCLLVISMFHGTFVDEEIRALLMFLWAIGLTGWYNSRNSKPVPVELSA